ncbi:hypothetical protein SPLC1_S061580 [Arthrospira platensis C1]|nr:hypothetical protein SPLC1_S061580 [Arthrospira platensis C1]
MVISEHFSHHINLRQSRQRVNFLGFSRVDISGIFPSVGNLKTG